MKRMTPISVFTRPLAQVAFWLLVGIHVAGCPTAVGTVDEADTDTDADADSDADADTDTDSDADTDADTDVCAQPLSCDAGIGLTGFNPLDGTTSIEMFHGQQGGWHVDAAVQVHNTSQVVRVLPKVFVTSSNMQLAGAEGLGDTYNQALLLFGQCSGEAWQMRAIFDEIDVDLDTICGFEGEELRLEIEVTDDQNNVATCSGTGIASLHPDDVSYCASLP